MCVGSWQEVSCCVIIQPEEEAVRVGGLLQPLMSLDIVGLVRRRSGLTAASLKIMAVCSTSQPYMTI